MYFSLVLMVLFGCFWFLSGVFFFSGIESRFLKTRRSVVKGRYLWALFAKSLGGLPS